jgi:hypothetical protein
MCRNKHLQMESKRSILVGKSIFVWRIVSAIWVFVNILLLWLTSLSLRDGETIIYWQRFGVLFLCLRFSTFAVLAISLWFATKKEHRGWLTVVAIFGAIIVLGFINLESLFISNNIEQVGTARLKGKIYYLASVERFGDETTYHLGECSQAGFVCSFRAIYNINLTSKSLSEILLSNDQQTLMIVINGETIYTFDGVNSSCRDTDFGYCAEYLH